MELGALTMRDLRLRLPETSIRIPERVRVMEDLPVTVPVPVTLDPRDKVTVPVRIIILPLLLRRPNRSPTLLAESLTIRRSMENWARMGS